MNIKQKKIYIIVLISVFLSLSNFVFSQVDKDFNTNKKEQKIENIIENKGEDADYSDIVENLEEFENNKINLNKAKIDDFKKLGLLTDIQIANLKLHIQKNGKLISLYELQSIDGYDLEVIKEILPYVTIDSVELFSINTLKTYLKSSKHQIVFRYQRTIEESAGYSDENKLKTDSKSAYYLGSPDKYYVRYRTSYGNKFSIGITGEKDAGEEFFKGSQKNGFDFYSAHAFVKDLGVVKNIAIGDFHAQFGQGLTMWSGLAFGKSADVSSVKKNALGLRPYTSTDENNFMRGAGVTLAIKQFELSSFYSRMKIDGNIEAPNDTVDNEENYISSIQESGLHTTIAEVEDKDALTKEVFGSHLAFKKNLFEIGSTYSFTRFDKSLSKGDDLYKVFDFEGKQLSNFGLDYNFVLKNLNFFGEFSGNSNQKYGYLGGVIAALDPKLSLVALYRNYEAGLTNFTNNAFAENTNASNEKGLYLGTQIKLHYTWLFSAYIDNVNYDWLKYSIYKPTESYDYSTQLTYKPSKKIEITGRYKYQDKPQNSNIENLIFKTTEDFSKQSFRFNMLYSVNKEVVFKNRVEYVFLNKKNSKEDGILLYFALNYKPIGKPFSTSFCYSLFDTDSYDSRIYAYENDVLYGYSIPGFYNKGSKVYSVVKYSLNKKIDLWLRFARTMYNNVDVIGSGLSEIKGNTKTEFKFQCRIKI